MNKEKKTKCKRTNKSNYTESKVQGNNANLTKTKNKKTVLIFEKEMRKIETKGNRRKVKYTLRKKEKKKTCKKTTK